MVVVRFPFDAGRCRLDKFFKEAANFVHRPTPPKGKLLLAPRQLTSLKVNPVSSQPNVPPLEAGMAYKVHQGMGPIEGRFDPILRSKPITMQSEPTSEHGERLREREGRTCLAAGRAVSTAEGAGPIIGDSHANFSNYSRPPWLPVLDGEPSA